MGPNFPSRKPVLLPTPVEWDIPVSNPAKRIPTFADNTHSEVPLTPGSKGSEPESKTSRRSLGSLPNADGHPKRGAQQAKPPGRRSDQGRGSDRISRQDEPPTLHLRSSSSSTEGGPRVSSSSGEPSPRASSVSGAQQLILRLGGEGLGGEDGDQQNIGAILALINEIPQPLVALDTFKMLVMQIREKFDKSSAAKLIKDHVEPMVRKFAASKNFTNFSEFSLKVNAVYSEMAMPVELVRQASVVPPSLDGIRPLQRLWVSDDVLLARSRINFLGRGGNEDAFEQACHFILGLIDKIGNVQDKLDALMLLAMKINASGHEELAQKIFARDVRPRAEILIPRIAVDVRESADGEIRAFNSMMNVPIDRFSVEEASKQIGALQGGNDPAKFKAACQQVLTVINQIGDERVKLDTLMLLVSRINECCAANDQSLAGDIFANQVAPQVYELEAKKGATNPEAGSALSQLFDAMESPIAVFASRETTPEFKSPPPAHS